MPLQQTPAKLTVDFSGVEVGARGPRGDRVPEGDYLMKVVDVQLRENKEKTGQYLSWLLQVVEPKAYAGKHVYHRTSLKREALWNLRGFLIDLLGEDKVPQRSLDLPLTKIKQAMPRIVCTLADGEPYNDKIRSEVQGTANKSEWTGDTNRASTDDEEEDETTAATTSSDDEDMDEIDVDDL